MMYDDLSDTQLLALVAWKEARGEGTIGMRAVMHVIKNRSHCLSFPPTIRSVIMQPRAFTSMTVESDPEYHLTPSNADPQYQYCLILAAAILKGEDDDPTKGAHYYARLDWFAANIVGQPAVHPHLAQIGKQDFYL